MHSGSAVAWRSRFSRVDCRPNRNGCCYQCCFSENACHGLLHHEVPREDDAVNDAAVRRHDPRHPKARRAREASGTASRQRPCRRAGQKQRKTKEDPQRLARQKCIRLASMANRCYWLSSAEIAVFVLTGGDSISTHYKTRIFTRQLQWIIQECKRILNGDASSSADPRLADPAVLGATALSVDLIEGTPSPTTGAPQPGAPAEAPEDKKEHDENCLSCAPAASGLRAAAPPAPEIPGRVGAHRAGFATGSAECGFRTAEEKTWSQCPPRPVHGFVVVALLVLFEVLCR